MKTIIFWLAYVYYYVAIEFELRAAQKFLLKSTGIRRDMPKRTNRRRIALARSGQFIYRRILGAPHSFVREIGGKTYIFTNVWYPRVFPPR